MSNSSRCAIAILLATLLQAVARDPASAKPGPSPTSGVASPRTAPTAAPADAADPGDDSDSLEPPDGKWLRDDRGREYYVERIELPPASYVWLDAGKTRVRLPHGLEMDAVAHDDGSVAVKIYRLDETPPAPPKAAVTPEDRERIARTYVAAVAPGRGVRLDAFDRGLPRSGQWRDGFAVADVNGDGHPDIVFGPPRKSNRPPTVFLGDGAGQWSAWSAANFPRLPLDYGDAAVADLNADGIPDVVLASHLRGLVATIGDGKGRFTAWTEGIEFGVPGPGAGPPAFSSRAIAITDWNRDGRPDILALGEGPQFSAARAAGAARSGSRGVVLYLNGGDGTWKKVARVGGGSYGGSIAVADFDGNGRPDFVTGSDLRGFRSILNLGQPDGAWKEVEIAELRPNATFAAVAARDFDADGRPDIASSFLSREGGVYRSGIDVLLARGAGWERRGVVAEESRIPIRALAAGDVDGDGLADLVAGDDEGRLRVFRGDGRGGFASASVTGALPAGSCRTYDLRVEDLDGVPGGEIVAAFADEDAVDPMRGAPSCPGQGGIFVWRVASD